MTRLTIGSRGSDLALYQANFIRSILEREHGCEVEIRIIKTAGDKIDNVSFEQMEGKGFFTKELEDALLAREIDLAVHSLKDLMTSMPTGLKLGAVGYRADRRELLLIRKESVSGDGLLPVRAGGVIGTSAARRKGQVAFHNPSLKVADLRGNVPTRVAKLREGKYDAILLASAGVTRLNLDLSDLQVIALDPEQFLPAPAQGILGIQIRDNDPRVGSVISKLGSAAAMREAMLERGLLARFDSGCSLPLGVFSEVRGDQLRLKAALATRDGDQWTGMKRTDITGTDVDGVISEAYDALQGSPVCPA
ncbi:MAG: hydroxymethylbilane synthase [candidate division Zixibacteria bacterium]|nr:hydroxymethylbilane synthase [candidate division Zixibacteria bacterium]